MVEDDLCLPPGRALGLEIHETEFCERGVQLRHYPGDDSEVFFTENGHEIDWDGVKEGNKAIPFLAVRGGLLYEDCSGIATVTHRIVIDALQNVVAKEVVDVALLGLNDEFRCDRSSRISANHGRVQEVLACREDAVEMVIVRQDKFEVSRQWALSPSDKSTELDDGQFDLQSSVEGVKEMLHDIDEGGELIGSDLVFSSLGPVREAVNRVIELPISLVIFQSFQAQSLHAHNGTYLNTVCHEHHMHKLGQGVDLGKYLHNSAKVNGQLHGIKVIHR